MPEPAETITITGITWASGAPELRIRRARDASVLVPLAGFAINYAIERDRERFCIGHKPFRDASVPWVDCDNVPLHDGRTCDRCAASDATFASQLHHAHTMARGELDPAVLRHLEQPNQLYLAAFRDGSVKVGTSTTPRREIRLVEQGAWVARIVADADNGFAVRVIEDQATVTLGLPQSVAIGRKLDGLVAPRPDAVLDGELDLWSARLHELIEERGDERVATTSARWRFSGAPDPIWNGLHRYPLKPESGAHDLVFVTASGRLAIVGRPGRPDRFVVDLRRLFGVPLVVGDHEPDELAVQDSLF